MPKKRFSANSVQRQNLARRIAADMLTFGVDQIDKPLRRAKLSGPEQLEGAIVNVFANMVLPEGVVDVAFGQPASDGGGLLRPVGAVLKLMNHVAHFFRHALGLAAALVDQRGRVISSVVFCKPVQSGHASCGSLRIPPKRSGAGANPARGRARDRRHGLT